MVFFNRGKKCSLLWHNNRIVVEKSSYSNGSLKKIGSVHKSAKETDSSSKVFKTKRLTVRIKRLCSTPELQIAISELDVEFISFIGAC
ncbi:hypothetical protein Gasu2_21020 [Galdieria sulphuraria]|uniref:Uncharacterized protein n=1 Tax=Galdieria sulphuraria TaxID=130081 RepID=M2WTG4_GALSU|nr:uncharacterized protein Gasu_51720 [Galdieria sulphuraria]EME27190.1 hypothetical protein Gasu_51720 [Galdieria sulphuraria]GJD07586.1 hypothetical protein Gasu2_19370 [Galdieria sulphuraria]GJD07764.1 hypothetical protein Gasu2_21020 [Galdieria sulphuraria]|eukprot:XP_005703710.1 hypothetical protein Gasu_51720 [Galdieria sulphuraria]